MTNSWFQMKQFLIRQDRCAMKVTTDGCLFGAWVAAQVLQGKNSIATCADAGAGTGLLSLMLAQKKPNVFIDAIELDTAAAQQAKENTALSPWKDRIQIMQADIRDFIFPKKKDYIFSNPPFYEQELKSPFQEKNLARHSQQLTLAQLLLFIKNNLADAGNFFLLLPFKRESETKKMLKCSGLAAIQIIQLRPQEKKSQFRMMLQGSHAEAVQQDPATGDLSITDVSGNYTEDFTRLLQDYYLHL